MINEPAVVGRLQCANIKKQQLKSLTVELGSPVRHIPRVAPVLQIQTCLALVNNSSLHTQAKYNKNNQQLASVLGR